MIRMFIKILLSLDIERINLFCNLPNVVLCINLSQTNALEIYSFGIHQ